MTPIRRLPSIASTLLLGGCAIYSASISVAHPDPVHAFTAQDQDAVRSVVLEIGRAAGFSETDTAAVLSAQASSRPYLHFVSLGAPGGSAQQRSIHVLGAISSDRREILVSVGDDARGEPLRSTQEIVDDLHAALERAFPACRVEVTSRKKLHLFAP